MDRWTRRRLETVTNPGCSGMFDFDEFNVKFEEADADEFAEGDDVEEVFDDFEAEWKTLI